MTLQRDPTNPNQNPDEPEVPAPLHDPAHLPGEQPIHRPVPEQPIHTPIPPAVPDGPVQPTT